MSAIVLAAILLIAPGDISIEQAETFASRDEATLQGEQAAEFFEQQGKALGMALYKCGVKEACEASGLMVVMRLDARGRVTRTWLNKQSVLGQCFEKELLSATFPTDGRPEFYTFIGFDF